MRIRPYDRVRDEKTGVVIKPAEDFVAGVGRITTMCAERHNVYWFVPRGGPAMTLDVIIDGLSGKGERYEITALDLGWQDAEGRHHPGAAPQLRSGIGQIYRRYLRRTGLRSKAASAGRRLDSAP